MNSTLDLIQRVLQELPTPLVGSVAYDGNKRTKTCTPKAYEAFKECYSIVRPRSILEIGTHAGGSALMALAFTDASVVSVDIGHTWITPEHSFADWGTKGGEGGLIQVHRVLNTYFPNRFGQLIGDSTAQETRDKIIQFHREQPFDFAFIDGNHAYDYVKSDIIFALSLGIKDLILDDYNSDDPNSEVARAGCELGLTLVKEWKAIHSGGVSFALTKAP